MKSSQYASTPFCVNRATTYFSTLVCMFGNLFFVGYAFGLLKLENIHCSPDYMYKGGSRIAFPPSTQGGSAKVLMTKKPLTLVKISFVACK